MDTQHLTQTLVESFNALADEVQNLSDRQTILEHKLRYAHEQFQYLADRHAPAAPEVSETLVNLQIPPIHNPSLANTNFVPLPKRKASDTKHQIAVIIREGRRVASSLTTDFSKSSRSGSRNDSRQPTTLTTMSAILEQDFTVEGKPSALHCPFQQGAQETQGNNKQATTSHPNDPLCAAILDETTNSQTAATKCPIRYLDQHSPEEIAEYLEKHKHELPRSHEVCVRRYQKDEEQTRKLDAKYGNIASMVEGLGKIHQPMLPERDTRPQSDVERASDDRVQDWAHTVTATAADDPECTQSEDGDEERQSHFDRPLKEVRVGESPSRPWGISVPVFSDAHSGQSHAVRPESPPAPPVHVPSPQPMAETPMKKTGKCPFDHTKFTSSSPYMREDSTPTKQEKNSVRLGDVPPINPAFTPAQASTSRRAPPAFLNPAGPSRPDQGAPQMVFTGPVFIGYPVEQAMQLMQAYQSQQQFQSQ